MAKQRKQGGASGGGLGRVYWVIGIVAVVAVAIIGYNFATGAGGAMATAPVEVEGLDDTQQLVEQAQGVVEGEDEAPITIIEFADYQCPGCGAFASQVEPLIRSGYVETGQAKFVFYDFPLVGIHPNAFLAARAGRCAQAQDRFWAYHDALFSNQGVWSPAANPANLFIEYAGTVGLDAEAFEACLRSDRFADLVTANMALGEELGVSGTPTVMVSAGGMYERVPQPTWENVRTAVERLKAQIGMEADTAAAGADPAGPLGPVAR